VKTAGVFRFPSDLVPTFCTPSLSCVRARLQHCNSQRQQRRFYHYSNVVSCGEESDVLFGARCERAGAHRPPSLFPRPRGGDAGRIAGLYVRAWLGVADEHGSVVRRDHRLLRAVLRWLCVPRRCRAVEPVRGRDICLKCWADDLCELPGGLLLHRRRGPSCGVPLRLLQRFGRRHDVRLLALRLRRGLLQQCDDFGGLRGHAGHVHAVLRRHGLHRRRRRARRVQRRHVLYAGRDVGGVHDVRGGRQLRPHGGWRLLQPRAELPLLRRLQQPRLSRLCHPATVHRLHEQRRRLHRLLPRLLRAVRGWRLRASIVWPVPGRHFQRRGRLQLLGLLVRGGLRLGGRRRSKLRGRGGQLRPVPRRLRLHWRRRAS
jgi:hypothetical protein